MVVTNYYTTSSGEARVVVLDPHYNTSETGYYNVNANRLHTEAVLDIPFSDLFSRWINSALIKNIV